VEYLPFRIAGRDFVVEAARVRAIVPFEGHQRDMPVFDLRERLGLPPVFYGKHPLLVVVETNVSESGLAGFAADSVSDLITGSSKECRNGKLRAARGRPKWILYPDSLRIEGSPLQASSLSPRSPAPARASHPG
jgi:chemotaxis signal transduction protein